MCQDSITGTASLFSPVVVGLSKLAIAIWQEDVGPEAGITCSTFWRFAERLLLDSADV